MNDEENRELLFGYEIGGNISFMVYEDDFIIIRKHRKLFNRIYNLFHRGTTIYSKPIGKITVDELKKFLEFVDKHD